MRPHLARLRRWSPWVTLLGLLAWQACAPLAGSLSLADNLTQFVPLRAALTGISLLALAALRRWPPLAPLALLLLLDLARLWPWLAWQPAAGERSQLTLTLCNVHDENRRHAELLAYLRASDCDVAVLLETDRAWLEALEALDGSHPHLARTDRLGSRGIVVRSRLPLLAVRQTTGVPDDLPQLEVELEVGGRRTLLVCSHPRSPTRGVKWQHRNAHIRQLAERARGAELPLLLAADLNCTMWSPHYAPLPAAGLRNARRGRGIQASWPAPWTWACGVPIDHVLTSAEWRVLALERGPHVGSDHLPLTARLAWRE